MHCCHDWFSADHRPAAVKEHDIMIHMLGMSLVPGDAMMMLAIAAWESRRTRRVWKLRVNCDRCYTGFHRTTFPWESWMPLTALLWVPGSWSLEHMAQGSQCSDFSLCFLLSWCDSSHDLGDCIQERWKDQSTTQSYQGRAMLITAALQRQSPPLFQRPGSQTSWARLVPPPPDPLTSNQV